MLTQLLLLFRLVNSYDFMLAPSSFPQFSFTYIAGLLARFIPTCQAAARFLLLYVYYRVRKQYFYSIITMIFLYDRMIFSFSEAAPQFTLLGE